MKYTSTGQKQMTDGDIDHRYTIRVYLLREGRPKYWEFHCPHCGKKVAELNGTMIYLSDLTHDGTSTGVQQSSRVRCDGKYCGWWFEFSAN